MLLLAKASWSTAGPDLSLAPLSFYESPAFAYMFVLCFAGLTPAVRQLTRLLICVLWTPKMGTPKAICCVCICKPFVLCLPTSTLFEITEAKFHFPGHLLKSCEHKLGHKKISRATCLPVLRVSPGRMLSSHTTPLPAPDFSSGDISPEHPSLPAFVITGLSLPYRTPEPHRLHPEEAQDE